MVPPTPAACVGNKELVGDLNGHVAVTCVAMRGIRVISPAIGAVTGFLMAATVSSALHDLSRHHHSGVCRVQSAGQLQLCQSRPNGLTLLLYVDGDQLGLHGSC